jgi:hypothetical protein
LVSPELESCFATEFNKNVQADLFDDPSFPQEPMHFSAVGNWGPFSPQFLTDQITLS